MERLTQSNFNYCKEYCADADGCAYAKGVIPTMCGNAAQYYRLAAYEETGLEPADIVAMYKTVEQCKVPLWKIQELAQAEAGGRLLTLPCKIGTPIYLLRGDTEHGYETLKPTNVQSIPFSLACLNRNTQKLYDFYYLTREEAETVLRKEDNNG